MAGRKPLGSTQLKRRYAAMTAGEVLKELETFEAMGALLAVALLEEDEQEKEELMMAAAVTMAALGEERIDGTGIKSVRGDDLCFRHLDETRSWQNFRFRECDLPRLSTVLLFGAPFLSVLGGIHPDSMMPQRRLKKENEKQIFVTARRNCTKKIQDCSPHGQRKKE